MGPSEREEGLCTFTWNPRDLTLDDLAKFTSLLFELHSEVAVPYVLAEDQSGSNVVRPKSPLIDSISMGSPLVIELFAAPGGIAIAALGALGWMVKHQDELGGFLPRVRRRRDEEEIERLQTRLKLIETRAMVHARGRSIERFEREYHYRDRYRPGHERSRDDRNRRRDDRDGRYR